MGHIQSYGDQPGVSVRSGSNLRDRWSSTFLSRSLHECMFMTDHICACMLWSLLRVSSLGFVGEQLCAWAAVHREKQAERIDTFSVSWEKSTVLAPCTGPLFCCVSNVVRHSRTACRVSGVFRNTKTLLYSQLCPQADGCSFVLVHVMLGGVEHIDFKAALVQSPLSLRSGSLKHITVVCHITKDLLLGASTLFKEWRGSSSVCIQRQWSKPLIENDIVVKRRAHRQTHTSFLCPPLSGQFPSVSFTGTDVTGAALPKHLNNC